MSKKQISDVVKTAIVMHEQKKVVNKIVRETINEELKVKTLVEHYLSEGPLSNVWAGLKGAAGAIGQGIQQTAGGAVAAARQASAANQAQAQKKAALDQINTLSKEVAKTRQKFTQDVLKNTQNLNAYHDSVLGLAQGFQQAAQSLGNDPELSRLKQQVDQAIGNLYYDLTSEKEHIDVFLKDLRGVGEKGSSATQGYKAKQAADKQRGAESKEYGNSMTGRARAATNRVPRK